MGVLDELKKAAEQMEADHKAHMARFPEEIRRPVELIETIQRAAFELEMMWGYSLIIKVPDSKDER